MAVVTGASGGKGAATARALAGAGARVALLGRRAGRLEDLAREIEAASGDNGAEVLAVPADVADPASLKKAARRVREALGRASVLVNNAAVMLPARFSVARSEDTREQVETNLLGAFEATRAFLGDLLEGGGDVVNVSSVNGRTALEGYSVYNATKWGLIDWSHSLRMELAESGVRVTVVEPGAVRTGLADRAAPEYREEVRRFAEDVDALDPEDVARAIVFAVSQQRNVGLGEVAIRPARQKL